MLGKERMAEMLKTRRYKCKCGGCENYLFVTDSDYFKNHKVIGIGKIGDNPEQLEGFLIPNWLINMKKLDEVRK